MEELADIKTAVSEAVTNCIVHAYRDTLGKIKLTARIYEGGGVYIQIKDSGCGIADVKKSHGAAFHHLRDRRAGGAGLCRHAVVYGQGVGPLRAGEGHHRYPPQDPQLQRRR